MKWILWGLTALTGIIAVILLMGKGSFLIAGYNTSRNKEKYNEKRLCRVVGGGLGVITLVMAAWSIMGDQFPVAAFVISIIAVVAAIQILSNTVCVVKGGAVQEKDRARDKIYRNASFLFTAVILVVVSFVLFTGNVTLVMHEATLEIQVSFWPDHEVPYASVKSVSYTDDLQRGSRKNGIGGPTLQAGYFKNAEFGDYKLYSYTSCDSFVVLDTEQGTVVLNGKDEAATRKLYEEIKEKVQQN